MFSGKRDLIAERRPVLNDLDSPILKAIGYGVNAPNPHNTQAWKFKIESDDELLFYVDEDRLLNMTDPTERQIHIDCGCFIEALKIGANIMGYHTNIDYFPEGVYKYGDIGSKPVAKISLLENQDIEVDDLSNYLYKETN